jgi:polyphosphate glucokinase
VRVLVIDVGGTHIKVAGSWDRVTHRIPSGPNMTATAMVRGVLELTSGWDFEAISLGYPGPVKDNSPSKEPINIGDGWTTLDFQKAFGKPVRVINDAAMQALGSYSGGRMLFLGLGTGLGTSIVDHWRVEPLEIAHLPYRKGESYEDVLGDAGMKKLGDERWEKHLHKVCELFRNALLCDGIVLGGGNARKVKTLPEAATRGANENAIIGGIRLWDQTATSESFEFSATSADTPTSTRTRTKSAAKKKTLTRKKPATGGVTKKTRRNSADVPVKRATKSKSPNKTSRRTRKKATTKKRTKR